MSWNCGLDSRQDILSRGIKCVNDRELTRWNIGGSKQRGIITYGLSANRQNPFAGAGHDAVFNTWRRFSKQVLYVAPPFVFFYYVMNWAVERYATSKIA
jgi:hypothetical protein